jgi:cytidylate kinase
MPKLSSIESMLERQGRLWEARQRREPEGTAAELAEGPWISISRQLGSGGTELGHRLGQELDWQVFDREILSAIAEHTHTRETVLRWLDEHAIGPFTDYLARLMNSDIPGQVSFQQETARVVWGLARQGNAIILGRGANWFLDETYGLRLRVTAPLALRVSRIAAAEGLDDARAEQKVREHDERQRGFVRQVFGKEIDAASGYDCILNLGSVGLETATRMVLVALRGKLPVGN